ncbi:glucan 1,4-alpha-glucosidase [Nitrospirillum amazonense]|nr:glucan 1,4-alpha-glucosidase [Nitrospirillum amazonense]
MTNNKTMGRKRAAALMAMLLASSMTGVAFAAVAPGAPGQAATGAYAGKTGIGTAYHAYDAQAGKAVPSRVWFSLAKGVVTETMYGLIHEVQLRELKLAIQGEGFLDVEDTGTDSTTSYLDVDAAGRPRSLAYKVVNKARNGKYEIEKQVFTDPDADTLMVRVTVRALKGGTVTPYLLVDPQMAGTGGGDKADGAGGGLHAYEGNRHLVVKAAQGFTASSVGFVGASDGLTQLRKVGKLDDSYTTTGDKAGNVALAGALAPVTGEATFDIVVGFGDSAKAADAAATATLKRGHDAVLAAYDAGWEGYQAKLAPLPELAKVAMDGGKLLYASALVLKAQEDKTHPGALIASLSAPWGDTQKADKPATGYKAVWPRDFYQCAMALLALGDNDTPKAALNYLKTIQVGPKTPGNHGDGGWFLQKTHVDGTPEWVGVQLDQTAMPLMLAWRLWRNGVISDAEAAALYTSMVKPAADFLVKGGTAGIGWNKETIRPPVTQQERWEEQAGNSPSTTAAVIAGLAAAAELAGQAGDEASVKRYYAAADQYSAGLEAATVTTNGQLARTASPGGSKAGYYLRIAPTGQPNAHTPLAVRNGQQALTEDAYVDGGFLELVRYGVRAPSDPVIKSSLAVLDDETLPENLRVKYTFHFDGDATAYPGWRRYGNDGYGEDRATGANYAVSGSMTPTQRGRVWPLLTGERGHYELAQAAAKAGGAKPAEVEAIRATYVRAMERFANQGLMIPEQVWDGVGSDGGRGYKAGAGTDSATPLAWAHAEYVKLLRSLHDGGVWDLYAPVAVRYATKP